jgi:DNA-binding NarL/FixJ family response regulator
VLRLLTVGNSYKQIAKELRLSPNTVRWYMQSLYSKLQVGNRTEAVNRARDLDCFSTAIHLHGDAPYRLALG